MYRRMNSLALFGCLVLLPSFLEAFNHPMMDPFEAAKTAAAVSSVPGMNAVFEAKSVVECRDGFQFTPDEFYKAFETCSVDNKLSDQPYCMHRCVYTKMGIIDDKGKVNEEMVEVVAEKIYRDEAEAKGTVDIKKSRASYKTDFIACYKSEAPDWPNTKVKKCMGLRKFVKCLKDKNAEVCKQKNQKLSEPPAGAAPANDYE